MGILTQILCIWTANCEKLWFFARSYAFTGESTQSGLHKNRLHFPHSMQTNKSYSIQPTKEQTRLLSWISIANEVFLTQMKKIKSVLTFVYIFKCSKELKEISSRHLFFRKLTVKEKWSPASCSKQDELHLQTGCPGSCPSQFPSTGKGSEQSPVKKPLSSPLMARGLPGASWQPQAFCNSNTKTTTSPASRCSKNSKAFSF